MGLPHPVMTVRISLAAVLADRIDGVDVVQLGGRTVGEVLHALTERHPALAALVWTAEGAFNEQLVAFLNRQNYIPECRATLGEQNPIILHLNDLPSRSK